MNRLKSIAKFYIEVFSNMMWGRALWIVIFLKLSILFFVLRLVFFKPVLSGKTESEKSDFVGGSLVERIDE